MVVEQVQFNIYAHGLAYASVCTTLSAEQATERMNIDYPTGLDSEWEIADEPFRTGQSNPCPCNHRPDTHTHYLFSC